MLLLSEAAQDRGRVSCQSLAFMRGFIFIWWSCRPLFPEWIIPICLCWALLICRAMAESITSILHTIFKIIQDRQHNSHSIRIQMTTEEQCFQKQTQLISARGLAQSCPAHCGTVEHLKTTILHRVLQQGALVYACACLHCLLVQLATRHVYNYINGFWTVSVYSNHKGCSPGDGSGDERGVPGGHPS